ADLEGDASAERGLLEDQREKFAAQGGVVAGGLRLDVRGELQEFARLRGTPFRSGEQIVDQQNRCSECCCRHFFLFTLPRNVPDAACFQISSQRKTFPPLKLMREPVQTF